MSAYICIALHSLLSSFMYIKSWQSCAFYVLNVCFIKHSGLWIIDVYTIHRPTVCIEEYNAIIPVITCSVLLYLYFPNILMAMFITYMMLSSLSGITFLIKTRLLLGNSHCMMIHFTLVFRSYSRSTQGPAWTQLVKMITNQRIVIKGLGKCSDLNLPL